MSKKILTVDDSKMVRMIVTSTFQPFDCEVVGAADGAEGVEVALREKPDIIFLDITMPVLNGIETLAKIRETPEIAAIPVVMLTAESDGQRLGMADQLKVSGYIAKPFKGEQLVALTRSIIPLALKAAPAKAPLPKVALPQKPKPPTT
jgi:two-component system chemotaxis response regulator CheY